MQISKLTPLTIIVLLALSSCDPGYTVTGRINNASTNTLIVREKIEGRDTAITILPFQTVDVYSIHGIGSGSKIPCCCMLQNDSIFISVDDTSLKVTKDLHIIDNWVRTITEKKTMFTRTECTIQISQSDIQ